MTREMRERVYWNVDEAAAYLGISKYTLYRWAKNATREKPKKKLGIFPSPIPPCIRLSKNYRFPIAEFKAWANTPTNLQQKAG